MSTEPATPPSPLVARRTSATLVEVGRLYVLTRDAYLSHPQSTLDKLASAADLRGVVGRDVSELGIPNDLGSVTGVRLVESLRQALRRLARGLSRHDRLLVLVDVLTTSGRPVDAGWGAGKISIDLATHLVPEISPAELEALLRRRRSVLRALRTVAGRSRPVMVDDEVAWVAETLAEVLGLDPSAAAVAAIRALHGGGRVDDRAEPVTRTAGWGYAGGALFDRLAVAPAAGPRALVGGALADAFPAAFLHHLATLDTVGRLRADLRGPLTAQLELLRADLAASSGAPVPGSLRALDVVTRRLENTRRLPGERLHLRFSRRHGLNQF